MTKSSLDTPKLGDIIPCHVFSEHESGKIFIFARGSFDKWCVYVGSPITDVIKHTRDPYPLVSTHLKIVEAKGCTKFKAKFLDGYTDVVYDFSAPLDVDYFSHIRVLSNEFGKDEVWSAFMALYDSIPQRRSIMPSRQSVGTVYRICNKFDDKNESIRETFDILTLAMIAENNREYPYRAILGKKVKALGIHQCIYSDMTLSSIENFSRGMKWRDLDAHCKNCGILTENLSMQWLYSENTKSLEKKQGSKEILTTL